ncbi:N-acetyltransferase family protein [Rubrivirga sp. IMCC43871]|uniref:GNAT family N-acetyltransferase n=1 Tax=Rubrivirga sp. IMCC43871 TaxID=3391575 RepID=UPI00398FF095
MPQLTVRPAVSSSDRAAFLDFPYGHYADDPHFVPPLRMDQKGVLNPKKNPFFEHGALQPFLAERDGEIVGRIAGIENGQHLATYGDGNGFFGFFECVEDYAVAHALLDAAADWLRARGLTGVRGPTNPTMNDVAGLLVDGFDRPPSILLPYNKPYYAEYLERWGFEKAMTMWAYYVHEAYLDMARMARGAEIVGRRSPGVTLRPLDPKRFDEDIAAAMRIYNEAWAENWGHVPYTEAEALHLASEMKPVIEPDLFLFAELDGEPIAFSASLPNLNQALKHLPRGRLASLGLPKLLGSWKLGGVYEIRMALMGVLPAHRNKGLDALLIHHTIVNGRRDGYQAAELSWVLDSNQPLKNALDRLNCTQDKEYAMFQASLA